MTKKQNDTQAKLSAGALRAAANIWKATNPPDNLDNNGAKFIIVDIAHIIDRETGVGELLEAAKSICANYEDDAAIGCSGWDELEQAIAKCESGAGSE